MAKSESSGKEIRQLAHYQVRPEALERCLAAIREFVAYVRANEAGTLRYDVWQEKNDPTRFVHIFTFRNRRSGQDPLRVRGGQEILVHPLPRMSRPRGVHRLPARGVENRRLIKQGRRPVFQDRSIRTVTIFCAAQSQSAGTG